MSTAPVTEIATPAGTDQGQDKSPSTPTASEVLPSQPLAPSATIWNPGTVRGQDPKYPPDRPGEAAGENGRVWKIYRDRVKDIDHDLLEGWNDTLNILLTFAGLFSAACTAFLIEVSKNLQPDWQRATALAVHAIYVHLNSTGPAPFDVPNPLSFTADTDARWINGLWFTSLTLSLIVSLLAILAKQWLNEYKSRTRAQSASPKMWAMRHNAFKEGLERWGMDAFISVLPLLLHAALFFFLTGLCFLLMPLDDYIAGVIIGITLIVAVFYVLSGLAPLIWADCPSATPMLRTFCSFWNDSVFPVTKILLFLIYGLLLAVIRLLLVPVAVIPKMRISKRYKILRERCSTVINEVIPFLGLATREGRAFSPAPAHAPAPSTAPPLDYASRYRPRALETVVADQSSPSTARFPASSAASTAPPLDYAFQYRPRATVTAATDQLKVLASDESFREASILAWMIRTLPADEDIAAALCATGYLSKLTHYTYFERKRRRSPLLDGHVRRAAVDALDAVAIRDDTQANEMVGSLMRACLFVEAKQLRLASPTKKLLSRYSNQSSNQVRTLSTSIIHSGDAWLSMAAPRLADLPVELAELVAISALREEEHSPGLIIRLLVAAVEIAAVRYPESIVSALEAVVYEYTTHRKHDRKPRTGEAPRLRFIKAVDVILRHHVGLQISTAQCRPIALAYAAAAQSLAADTDIKLPIDLQDQLLFPTDQIFHNYEFSVADLNAIATLLLCARKTGQEIIRPAAVLNLLDHIGRRTLGVESATLQWIQAVFHVGSDPTLVGRELQKYPSAVCALSDSHLRLLRPMSEHPHLNRSPWSQLLATLPISENAELLAELAHEYSTLILILHRRGYIAVARAILRELLPRDKAQLLISRGTRSRYHLALHAKIISPAWWTEVSQQLKNPLPALAQVWVECSEFTDAAAFVTALSTKEDCLTCARERFRSGWSPAPPPPDANEPDSKLTVNDPSVWNPQPVSSSRPAPWYAGFVRCARRALRPSVPLNRSGDKDHREGMLESGRAPA